MKEKEQWFKNWQEGFRMEWCRPPTEQETWIGGFEMAKMRMMERIGTTDSPAWIGESEIK